MAKLPFTWYVSIVNYVGMSAIKKYVPKKVNKFNYNAWKIMAPIQTLYFLPISIEVHTKEFGYLRFLVKDVFLSEVH